MPDIPAAGLCALLARLLQASGPEPAAQRAAIAGFQQLHAQLRRWNDGLVSVLRDYPGFAQSGAPADYDRFLDRLAACREALGEADDSSDPQARLLQDARNTTDFLWQLAADAGPYRQRRPRVIDAIQTYEAASAMAFGELRAAAQAAGVELVQGSPVFSPAAGTGSG